MTLAPVQSSSTVPSPLASPEAREDLNRYAEAGGFTLRAETHPWYAAFASVSRLDEARAASSILAELRGHNVPDLQQAAERLASVPGFEAPTTVRETATLVSLLARVRATLEVLHPDTYLTEAHTLDALLAATATPGWRAERGVSQSWWQRALLARRARGLAAARGTRREDLHSALAEAAATRTKWASLAAAGTRPALPSDPGFLDTAVPAAEAALTGLDELTALLGRKVSLTALPFEALTDLLDRLASDEGTLYRLPRLRELHDTLTAQGLTDLLAQLTEEQADVKTTAALIAQRTALDPTPPSKPTTAEPEPEAIAEAEPEAAPEAITEAQPEADAEAEAIAQVELAADTKPVAEAEAIAEAEPQADTEAEPIAQAVLTADTEPVAETEAIAEAQPEADAAQSTEVAPEAITEARPEADAKAEPIAEAELVAADTEPVAEAGAIAEAEPEAIAKAEAITDTATEPVAEAEPDADTEAEPVAQVEQAADTEPVAEAEAIAEAEPEADAAQATAAQSADATPEPEAATEAQPEADAEADPIAQAELMTDTEPVAETEAITEAEPEAIAEAEAITDTATEPVAEAQPDAAPEGEAVLPDAAPAAEAEAEAGPGADVLPDTELASAAEARTRPDVVAGKPVTAYSAEQLEAIVRWIDADGVERSDEELLRAGMKELGFSRLGPRIKEALGAAVAAARG